MTVAQHVTSSGWWLRNAASVTVQHLIAIVSMGQLFQLANNRWFGMGETTDSELVVRRQTRIRWTKKIQARVIRDRLLAAKLTSEL
ncbi:MAG: hypothetical protein CL912_31095 [Deltaproteobacteria bacterium]|nr:hypothetical protein [Deltaproteobacteria bacterium]